MSNKRRQQLLPTDVRVRNLMRVGMFSGTVLTIEFVSGFEMFNTRPYHNYETWAQGWRITRHPRDEGESVIVVQREDLDDALDELERQIDAIPATQ
jgi:hypothetical protein